MQIMSFPSHSASLFALIIGINQYLDPDLQELECAVHDARAINAFLLDQLQVPPNHIRLLTDSQATYSGILSAFRTHLVENPSIHPGDPIVLYYAGHGSRFIAPDGWPTDDGNYECICPSDRNTVAADGNTVEDIADWELGRMLVELASVKESNITVIMDSCHAGSGTRTESAAEKIQEAAVMGYHPRYAAPIKKLTGLASFSDAIAATTNFAPSGARHTKLFPSLYHPDISSHILLAATRQDELAWEQSISGVTSGLFTSRLLEKLEKIDLPRTSYISLMSDVGPFEVKCGEAKSFFQNPQLEGKKENQQRVLFNGKALGVDKRLILMTKNGQTNLGSSRWRLEAGTMHGVSVGTEFTVRRDQFYSSSFEPLGQVVAVEVHGVWSIVEPKEEGFAPPPDCYAVVSSWANPPFKLALRPPLDSSERHMMFETDLEKLAAGNRSNLNLDMHIVRTEPEEAKLVVSIAQDKVVFERRDHFISQNCPQTITWERVGDQSEWEIINRATHFDYCLYYENPTHPYANKVSIALCRIDLALQDITVLHKNSSTIEGFTRTDIESDSSTRYALKLHNESSDDLWCSLLCFDASDYSITSLYAPPSRTMKAPLRSGKSFTIGDGSSGVMPFGFLLNEGEQTDATFMKVLISDVYADLEVLEQTPSFVYVPPETGRKRRGGLAQGLGLWDSLVMVVAAHQSLA